MNKIWAIIFAGLIVLALALFAIYDLASTPTTPSPVAPVTTGPNVLPTSSPTIPHLQPQATSSAPAFITLSTQAGGSIKVYDFITSDPATIQDPYNNGYYYLGYHKSEGVEDPTATDTPPYIIEYIEATQYFNIVLLQEPLGQVRTQAQLYLQDRLGITQTEMCSLKYMVSTPHWINEFYTNTDLRFSFCPGAAPLP